MNNDERLKRMEDKIDKVVDSVHEINITLAAQHISLETHIKRTNILEKKLEPVERHVSMVQGAIKLIMIVSAIAAAVVALK